LQEALALYQRVRSPAGEAVCRQFLGMTLTALGALDRGRRQLEAGLAVAQTSTMRSHVSIRLNAALARNRLDAGDIAAARHCSEQGLALAELHQRCICNASLACVAAASFAFTGDVRRAEELAAWANELAGQLTSPLFRCMAGQAGAMVAALQDHWSLAFEQLDVARAQAERHGFPYELARVHLARSFVHLQRAAVGDRLAATQLAGAAGRQLLRLGARAAVAQTRSSLRFLLDQSRRA
jgi:hypothetical protein